MIGTQQNHRETEGISPLPCQFGHELEVHAIDAGDQRRRDTDDRDDREHLEEIILLDRYEAQHGVEEKLDLVRELSLVFVQRTDVLGDRAKTRFELVLEPSLVAGLPRIAQSAPTPSGRREPKT